MDAGKAAQVANDGTNETEHSEETSANAKLDESQHMREFFQDLGTKGKIRTGWIQYARKDDLISIMEELGLETDGSQDVLRRRLRRYLQENALSAATIQRIEDCERKFSRAPSPRHLPRNEALDRSLGPARHDATAGITTSRIASQRTYTNVQKQQSQQAHLRGQDPRTTRQASVSSPLSVLRGDEGISLRGEAV